ncbi:alpha/beta hydrolase [bacterium 1xD42-62]|uniref:Alpha/beta hydrolase n=1 Tax=Parablautia muri TaxID=2320879 RepID=A0A9X5BFB1_9FIRM|nr:alpha/beta hydrolase [Parablautia muri]
MLYQPAEQTGKRKIGIMLMHSDADYYGFIPAPELAKRGYTVLASNVTCSRGPFENKLEDLGRAIAYLKKLPEIEKIVLLGHSGGATLMSAYQAVAENGVQVFQHEGMIVKMQDVGPFSKADAVMLLDSNWGNGIMTLVSLEPSIVKESSSRNLKPGFELFDPANGYASEGAHYLEEFVKNFHKAQEKRNEKLIDYALERLEKLEKGEGEFDDDEPFVIAGGSQIAPNNKLFPQDIRYLSHTQGKYDLIHGDGSVTNEVIRSLRKPHFDRNMVTVNRMATDMTTIKTFLTCSCIRTKGFGYDETHIYGIEWDSGFSCTPGNIRHVRAPLLLMGMTGSYEFLASEQIYRNAASGNKTIAFVEGASHNFVPQEDAEEYKGQFGDTVKNCFDYVDGWLEKTVM